MITKRTWRRRMRALKEYDIDEYEWEQEAEVEVRPLPVLTTADFVHRHETMREVAR